MGITHFPISDLHKIINELGGKNTLSISGLILFERVDEKGTKFFHYGSATNIYTKLRNLHSIERDEMTELLCKFGVFNDENPYGWHISVVDCVEPLIASELTAYKFRAVLDGKVPYGNNHTPNATSNSTPYEVGVSAGCAYCAMIVRDFLQYFDMYATSDTRNKKREHASVAFKWLVDFAKN